MKKIIALSALLFAFAFVAGAQKKATKPVAGSTHADTVKHDTLPAYKLVVLQLTEQEYNKLLELLGTANVAPLPLQAYIIDLDHRKQEFFVNPNKKK